MPSVEDYQRNPDRVLIDIAVDPAFQQFIDPGDIEMVAVDLGDGRQVQVQALRRGSVRKVIDRIIAKGHQANIDIKDWICASDEFDLCSKLDNPVGELMRQLNDFLNNKLVEGGLHAAGLLLHFTVSPVGAALNILAALGWVNGVFVELCHCPNRA